MEAQFPKELFGLQREKINLHSIYLCVKSELASLRQGTHKTKTLAEVSGSGKKPWRQKGTGRARAGTRRSPIWRGGGIVFGPTPDRNYLQKVSKSQRRLAFLSVLTLLKEDQRVKIVDFQKLLESKVATKKLVEFLKQENLVPKTGSILIGSANQELFLSARNLKWVNVVKPLSLTVSLLQKAAFLLLDQEAVEELLRVFGKTTSKTEAEVEPKVKATPKKRAKKVEAKN